MNSDLRQFKAEVFQALGHPTRIAIVDALREKELSATQLIDKLHLEQANASQHLAILRRREIVATRKEGNRVFYSLRHPVLLRVLELLREYFSSLLSESAHMLEELNAEKPARRGTRA